MKQNLNILRGWLWLMLLAIFAACSNDNDEPEPPQLEPEPEQSFPLTIEVTENPMIIDGAANNNVRKTDITTSATFDEFTMNYVYGTSYSTGSVSATKDGEGKWTSTDGWPLTEETVYWYAYTGDTPPTTNNKFYPNSGNPYLDFTVDNDVANQKDLLVATASGTYSDTGGNLALTFDHACAALRLWVKKSKNLDAYTLSISSIVLKHVVKQGKYYYGTGEWTLTTNDADYTNYTLFSGSAQTVESTDYIPLDGGTPVYLFMIPQTLEAWNPTGDLGNTYLELACSITKGGTPVYSGTAYIPFAATLAKGTQYNVKINIGKNSLYSGPNTKVITE